MDRPTRRSGGFAPVALLALLALASAGAGQAGAQVPAAGRGEPAADSVPRRVILTTPRSGPPGTKVTIQPMFLPSVTPVQISFGGTQSGFEVLAQMMTNEQGELTEAVTFEVPAWTAEDGVYRFMVLDLYFAPLAMSDVFYVTRPDGLLERHGRITDAGSACPTLRSETDGQLYVLSGATGELQAGEAVVVEGRVIESKTCKEGVALEVRKLQRVTRSGAPVPPGVAHAARAEAPGPAVLSRSVDGCGVGPSDSCPLHGSDPELPR